jgi:hypothetical protein
MVSSRLGLAALPFLAGIACAAEPLSEAQMGMLTAGFFAQSIADAQASGKVVATFTATLAQVGPVMTGDPVSLTLGGATPTAAKSVAASALPTFPLPGLGFYGKP